MKEGCEVRLSLQILSTSHLRTSHSDLILGSVRKWEYLFSLRWDVLPTEANLYCKYCSMLAEPDVTSSGQASFSCNPTRDMIKWASQSPEETSSRSAASEFTAWLAWGLLWTLCCHSSDNVIHKLHPFHFYPWVNSIPQFIEQIAINLLIKQAQTRNSGKTWTPGTQSSCVRFTKHTLAHMGKSSQKAKQLLMNLRALASQDLELTLLTSPRLLCGGGCTPNIKEQAFKADTGDKTWSTMKSSEKVPGAYCCWRWIWTLVKSSSYYGWNKFKTHYVPECQPASYEMTGSQDWDKDSLVSWEAPGGWGLKSWLNSKMVRLGFYKKQVAISQGWLWQRKCWWDCRSPLSTIKWK